MAIEDEYFVSHTCVTYGNDQYSTQLGHEPAGLTVQPPPQKND